MNDKSSIPNAGVDALTLDQLLQEELACLERMATIQMAKERKLAEFEEARARFNVRAPGTPGRKPKVPT